MSEGTRHPLKAGILALGVMLIGWYFWHNKLAEPAVEASRAHRSSSAGDEPPLRRHEDPSFRSTAVAQAISTTGLEILVTDDGGLTIPGALVCALAASEAEFRATASNCQTAGADGRTRWPALANGGRVTASAAGFAAQERKVQGAEPVTIALSRVASSVAGYIEDSNGGPVVGALSMVLTEAGGESVVGSALSDSHGAFVVSAPPGPSQLRVMADGYATWQREITAPEAGIRVVMALGLSIVGHVTDVATGEPLGGVVVQARRHDVRSGSFGSATASADGAFTIANLGPGMHLVRLVDDGWAAESKRVSLDPGMTAVTVNLTAARAGAVELTLNVGGKACQQGGVVLEGPSWGSGVVGEAGLVRVSSLKPGDYMAKPNCAGSRPAGAQPLKVTQGETVRKTLDLDAGLSIQGQVAGGAGSELKDLTVRVFDSESGSTADCTTDAQGRFACGGLIAGQYECWVNQQDLKLSDTVKVRLASESNPASVTLALVANGNARVTVKDSQGGPLDNVQLALRAAGKVPLPATPLGNGRSEFRAIPVGRYDVELEGGGDSDVRQPISVEASKTTEVSLVLPTRDVEGRVLDAAGMPQPDTWVMVWGASSLRASAPEVTAMTDAEGRFVLRRLARKSYTLRVEGPGGTVTRSPVEASSPLTLQLAKPTEATGNGSSAGTTPEGGVSNARRSSAESAGRNDAPRSR